MAKQQKQNTDDLGQQAIALAEQLGRIAGTVQGTAEAWVQRQNLAEQLTLVRDGANRMLEQLASGAEQGRRSVQAATEHASRLMRSTTGAARKRRPGQAGGADAPRAAMTNDPAHAPGKRRRKPGPSPRGVKKSDEAIPKLRTAQAVRQRRKNYA